MKSVDESDEVSGSKAPKRRPERTSEVSAGELLRILGELLHLVVGKADEGEHKALNERKHVRLDE
jgi:hypothetical protein